MRYFTQCNTEESNISDSAQRLRNLAQICKRLGSPGIDSKESIPPAHVA
jgi:hypothetical protein